MTPRPAVFLDLNGTMVLPVQPRSLEDLELISGVPEAVARLTRNSLVCPVVTVQSRIAKGTFSHEEFDSWFADFATSLSARDAEIVGPYVCPHRFTEGCACKKPKTLLYEHAAAEHDLDLARSWTIGDTAADVLAAAAFGGHGCLVRTGWGNHPNNLAAVHKLGSPIVDSFSEAVEWVLA